MKQLLQLWSAHVFHQTWQSFLFHLEYYDREAVTNKQTKKVIVFSENL